MDNKTLIIIGIAAYFLWKNSQKKNIEQDSGDGSNNSNEDFVELKDVMVETHGGGGEKKEVVIDDSGSGVFNDTVKTGSGNTWKQKEGLGKKDFRIGMLR